MTAVSETRELAHAVGQVFETMLGLPAGVAAAELPAGPDLMTAAVYLSGDYPGAIFMHCLPPQACAFAGRFLSVSAPGAVDDAVRDVLAELTNMVAGNLTCALHPGTVMSVPSVFAGPAVGLRPGETRDADSTSFLTPSGPFWITTVATGLRVHS